MYRTGHYGVALLVWAPVGFLLLTLGRPAAAVLGGAAVLALTPLPDYDHRLPLVTHRGATHTLLFAGLAGAALGGAATLLPPAARASLDLPPNPTLAAFCFGVGALAVGAHLLGDLLTPAGVRPLWPLSGRTYALGLATSDSRIANALLLALGVFATVAATLAAWRV
jgi:inner membrane protein